MKGKFVCLLATLVLLLAVFPLAAQETNSGMVNGVYTTRMTVQSNTPYVVQPGDNLWNLAGAKMGDPLLWQKIWQRNPFLRSPGRLFTRDGFTYVIVHPGETLQGLEELGIFPTVAQLDQLQLPQPRPVVIKGETPTWAWWPLAFAVLLLIGCYLIYRMLTRDPATAGPAMVPGGVTAQTARDRFQTMGTQQHFTFLEMVTGRIWGVLNTQYANRRMPVPRRFNGEQAYQARVRFTDGHEEQLYMLQACGNDLRYGGISRHLPGPEFRFVADHPVATATASNPAPVAVPDPKSATAPVTEPAPAKTVAPTPQGEGVISFEFKRANNGQPNMVRLQGIEAEEFTFSVGPDGTTLRYREVEDGELAAK